MAWDRNRPVPWRRLVKEYAIYAAIAVVVLLLLNRGREVISLIVAVIAAGPFYIGLGAVLAKFGYQRKTLAELRTPRAATTSREPDPAPAARPRPAPTRRTASGRNRPNRPNRRKR